LVNLSHTRLFDVVADDFDAAPVFHFLSVSWEGTQLELAIAIRMRTQQLSNALSIPNWSDTPKDSIHHGVRAFVNREVAPVVVAWLFVDPDLVESLCGIGTGAAIPVNQMLIDTAIKSNDKAAAMMVQWSFGQSMQLGISPTPGMQPIGIGRHIMSSNPLAVDLQACANYLGGDEAAQAVTAPAAMILAGQDKMTPLKAGKAVAEKLNAQTHVLNDYGHMLPIEAPKKVLHLLRDFIQNIETQNAVMRK